MTTHNFVAGVSRSAGLPSIRHVGLKDLTLCLREGYGDFQANPTHLIFLCLIYPVMGFVLARLASGQDSLALVYPLIAGFALVGPFASVGLYELSRRRERGQTVSVANALDIFRSPRIVAIMLLGVAFVAIFVAWLAAAQAIYDATMPVGSADTVVGFVHSVFGTAPGLRLIVVGSLVGFVFAATALTLGVVSFPLLVDVDLAPTPGEQALIALQASVKASLANPLAIAAWGLIVAIGLAIGVATLFVGFAVTMPILGHATWHLYRRLIA